MSVFLVFVFRQNVMHLNWGNFPDMELFRGILLTSVPKSGTMFLSRAIGHITEAPTVFGMTLRRPAELAAEVSSRTHPMIVSAMRQGSPSPEVMSRRFSAMVARNRDRLDGSAPVVLSDHGLHNFLRFLRAPEPAEVVAPEAVVAHARLLNLAPVFLSRGLGDVAASLAHFLASGKSYLLDLRGVEAAARVVAALHLPVLADLTTAWQAKAAALGVLAVRYERLTADPAGVLAAVCRHGRLPQTAAAATVEAYRSWTYRAPRAGSWRDIFDTSAQARIDALQAQLDGVPA